MFRIVLTTVIFLVIAPSVYGKTGNELLKECMSVENRSDDINIGMCYGYIEGVLDSHRTTADLFDKEYACDIPNSVTYGQIVSIVQAHLRKYPEFRHNSAAHLVLTALHRAFPNPDW